MPTSEEISNSERESASEEDSATDGESESKFDSESEYEGESDYDPDSDGDSDSGGDPDSRNILESEGGTYGGPTFDTVLVSKGDSEQVQRPQRIRNILRSFAEFDIL